MAELKITSLSEEQEFEKYVAIRNATRDAVANGVYPNCVKALEVYAALDESLKNGLSEFSDFHNETMSLVLPHIEAIRTAMQAIVGRVQAIDSAAYEANGSDVFGTYKAEEDAE